MPIKPKGLQEILEENVTLIEKYTYEEYEAGKTIPQNSDDPIDKAYENYKKIKSGEV